MTTSVLLTNLMALVTATAALNPAHGEAFALNPAQAARKMADCMIKDTKDAEEFKKWGYGQSIIVDALLLASEEVDGMGDVMSSRVNPVLDGYLTQKGAPAFNLTHGK